MTAVELPPAAAAAARHCSRLAHALPPLPVTAPTPDRPAAARLQVGWRIDVMPPGVQYATHKPCPGCARPSFSTRFPFAGLTGIGGDIWVDGLNSEGLTAAYLWLDTHPFELNHRQANKGARVCWRWRAGAGPERHVPHAARWAPRGCAAATQPRRRHRAWPHPAACPPANGHTHHCCHRCRTPLLPPLTHPAAPRPPVPPWPGWT